MDTEKWNSLGFDPIKDKKWPTPQDIRERLKEKEREARKIRLISASIILAGLCLLMLIIWLFV